MFGIVIFTIFLTTFILFFITSADQSEIFFFPQYRVWELGLGSLCSLIEQRKWSFLGILKGKVFPYIGVIGILFSIMCAAFSRKRLPLPPLHESWSPPTLLQLVYFSGVPRNFLVHRIPREGSQGSLPNRCLFLQLKSRKVRRYGKPSKWAKASSRCWSTSS